MVNAIDYTVEALVTKESKWLRYNDIEAIFNDKEAPECLLDYDFVIIIHNDEKHIINVNKIQRMIFSKSRIEIKLETETIVITSDSIKVI